MRRCTNQARDFVHHAQVTVAEHFTRDLLDEITTVRFTKARPLFLQGLELDGYNEEHKIAFEYNGKQHYEHVPFLHKTVKDFEAQRQRDERKRRLCTEHTHTHRNTDDLEEFLQNELTYTSVLLIINTSLSCTPTT